MATNISNTSTNLISEMYNGLIFFLMQHIIILEILQTAASCKDDILPVTMFNNLEKFFLFRFFFTSGSN